MHEELYSNFMKGFCKQRLRDTERRSKIEGERERKREREEREREK